MNINKFLEWLFLYRKFFLLFRNNFSGCIIFLIYRNFRSRTILRVSIVFIDVNNFFCCRFFYFFGTGFIFFFKQKTAYEIASCLVGSEMCIRDSTNTNRPIAGDKCWVINCEIKDTCNFWLSFEKDDISSLKSISLSKPNQKPSIIAVSYTHLTLPTNREV